MALSQQDWFEKLKAFVPSWWFEQEKYNVAVFQGMAAVLSELQATMEAHAAQTFITRAAGQVLDAHGDERSVDRLDGEPDAAYQSRIRNFINQTSKDAIKQLVDSLLTVGTCIVKEDAVDVAFSDRGAFLNRHELLTEHPYNCFTILVQPQQHAAYTFFGRGAYLNRQNFIGTTESTLASYDKIIAALNAAKAFGTLYKIVELSS